MPNYFLLAFIVLTVLFFVIGRALYGNRTLLYFGGHRRKRGYFEGWYLKLFNEKETLAFIPSYHADVNGKRYAMLQIIGTDKPLKFVFDADELEAKEDEFRVRLPGCDFSCKGMRFSLECCGHSLNGGIVFDGVAPPKKDIMGFFAGFPFMQCKHGVLSMLHNVNGKIIVDGKVYDFDGAYGYMEKDFGSSFPSSYVWTQSSDGKNSVMLSVARIPYLGATFTGCVAFVYVGGREYRLATYNGAKVMRNDAECVAIGRFAEKLEIYPIRENAHALAAPESGSMSRTVYETAAAVVRCVFTIKGDTVLDMTVSAAGYERCD